MVEILDEPEFGKLPEARGRVAAGSFERVIAQLRAHPLQWAKIATASSGGALPTAIRRGHNGFTPAGHFEGSGRRVAGEKDKFEIWARYVGPVDYPDPPAEAFKATPGTVKITVPDDYSPPPIVVNPAVLCARCRHPVRHHTEGACTRGDCECTGMVA